NVVGLADAHSTEIDPETKYPVIHLPESHLFAEGTGGSLRLGSYPCVLKAGSKVQTIYNEAEEVHERHRNRYEFNRIYKEQLEEAGLIFSGLSPDGEQVEIIELKDHPWFVACQFHPEFKSRPTDSH